MRKFYNLFSVFFFIISCSCNNDDNSNKTLTKKDSANLKFIISDDEQFDDFTLVSDSTVFKNPISSFPSLSGPITLKNNTNFDFDISNAQMKAANIIVGFTNGESEAFLVPFDFIKNQKWLKKDVFTLTLTSLFQYNSHTVKSELREIKLNEEYFHRTPKSAIMTITFNVVNIDKELSVQCIVDVLDKWKEFQTKIGLREDGKTKGDVDINNNQIDTPSNQPKINPQENSANRPRLTTKNNSTFFSGTKKFCDGLNSWFYLVTISADTITIKAYPDKKNIYYKNKTKATEIITGIIKGTKIVTKDGTEYLDNRFKYENGVFSEINNEGGYNDYAECN